MYKCLKRKKAHSLGIILVFIEAQHGVWPSSFLHSLSFTNLCLYSLCNDEREKTIVTIQIFHLASMSYHTFRPYVPCAPWILVWTWEHPHYPSLTVDRHGVHISSSTICIRFSLLLLYHCYICHCFSFIIFGCRFHHEDVEHDLPPLGTWNHSTYNRI